MTQARKLLEKFRTTKGQVKWVELTTLFKHLGFTKIEGEGSRVTFTDGDVIIKLHKPHPQKEVKAYAIRQIKQILDDEGFI